MSWNKSIYRLIPCLIAVVITCSSRAAETEPLLLSRSTGELEARLLAIDTELDTLAHYSLRSGMGAIGYRSTIGDASANRIEWVEVELAREYPIDEVVLVPCIQRDTEEGFQADAFPTAFRIVAGTADDRIGSVVAEYDRTDSLLPRIAPFGASLSDVTASWVRIETTSLSPRGFDGMPVFQLAELLVFSGEENVALRRPVKSSTNAVDISGAWSEQWLVDGFMPYLMDSAQGSQSAAFIGEMKKTPTIQVDLGKPYPISRIHLHAVDQSDTVPQAFAGDLGIPIHFVIDGANQPNFSDATRLVENHRTGVLESGPILMWRFPEVAFRYFRLVSLDSIPVSVSVGFSPRIGFSEIEIFASGRNVAFEKEVHGIGIETTQGRSYYSLTDGNNLYGKIISVRTWLDELAQRHDLESERPLVASELARRYAKQKSTLTWVSWLAGILAIGIGFIILIDRNIRMRQLAQLKERFAADLHDELGADLHTIGLLCDLAKESTDSPERLVKLLDRTRTFSERSGAAARYCTNMLEAKGLCEDLTEELGVNSRRLLADLEYEYSFDGKPFLQELKPRKRIDLFLFHKECLTNIIRHSGATKVTTQLTANRQRVELTITDNGHGLEGTLPSDIPPSLKRRARLLGAHINIDQPPDGGVRINLTLKTKKFFLFS